MQSIARNPKIYQVVHENIKKGILQRFPYCAFFIKEPNHIQVLAVFNAHRNPSEWKRRTIIKKKGGNAKIPLKSGTPKARRIITSNL
jgi:hypothetical protein